MKMQSVKTNFWLYVAFGLGIIFGQLQVYSLWGLTEYLMRTVQEFDVRQLQQQFWGG
jgi:hypothetical protein